MRQNLPLSGDRLERSREAGQALFHKDCQEGCEGASMAFPARLDPASLPTHVLFPEDYRRSARMITQDFLLLGGALVAGIVGCAALVQMA
jgi:hypothetical protein